jgi:uncharacterized protein YaiE (UPF0345 family)
MLKANSYFDGKVQSIGFQGADLPATVGVMVPGSYNFGTDKKETMTVVCGALKVKLPGQESWQVFDEGQSFVVEAHKNFDLEVEVATAYLCKYE